MLSRDPTPEEIREACWRIQESWSEAERLRRAGVNYVNEVEIHKVVVSELVASK